MKTFEILITPPSVDSLMFGYPAIMKYKVKAETKEIAYKVAEYQHQKDKENKTRDLKDRKSVV